jgi:hypothetical protein
MRSFLALSFLAALAASSPTSTQQPWEPVDGPPWLRNTTLVGRDEHDLSKRQDGGVRNPSTEKTGRRRDGLRLIPFNVTCSLGRDLLGHQLGCRHLRIR